MAENEVIEQPGGNVPAVESTQEPTAQPTIDVNATVKVGDSEVPISELVNGYQKLGSLEEYQKNASMLVRGTGSNSEERNSAMRYVLEAEGYSPAQIESHIQATQNFYDQESQEQQETSSMEENTPTPQEQAPEGQSPVIDEAAREEIERVRSQNNQMMVDMLNRDLQDSMQRVMGSNENIRTLLDKSKQLAGEEGFDERRANIESEVQRIAMEGMRSRRNRGEKFDKSWFDQETTKAADMVYQRVRSVIGDPDKIQRAPETVSEFDSFISKPPAPDPKWEKGDNMGTASNKARDFTVDTLSRIAGDMSSGGNSRL